jgi:hypothetical protein
VAEAPLQHLLESRHICLLSRLRAELTEAKGKAERGDELDEQTCEMKPAEPFFTGGWT